MAKLLGDLDYQRQLEDHLSRVDLFNITTRVQTMPMFQRMQKQASVTFKMLQDWKSTRDDERIRECREQVKKGLDDWIYFRMTGSEIDSTDSQDELL